MLCGREPGICQFLLGAQVAQPSGFQDLSPDAQILRCPQARGGSKNSREELERLAGLRWAFC